MELINYVGAQASKDGRWLLVTFARKDTDEKVRFLVPFEAKRGPVAFVDEGKTYVFFPVSKKEEEPKQEEHPKCLENLVGEEDIPF